MAAVWTLDLRGADLPAIKIAANAAAEEIQKALDRLPGGGEVDLPPGKFMVQQPIFLRHDNQTLRGSGTNTILILADKANCPVIILGAPLSTPRRTTLHVRVADLFIDGNRKNQPTELWRLAVDGSQINNNGVSAWDVDNARVENVACCRCRSGGLVAAVVRHLTVTNFEAFENQFDGLACYRTENSHFAGLRLHNNPGAGISLDNGFDHNVIDGANLTDNDLGIFMRDSRNNLFETVTISKSRSHGVFMAQTAGETPEGWKLFAGTECTGNIFYLLAVQNCGGSAFVVNNSACTNNAIRAATFLDNAKGGLNETDGKSTGVSVTLADPAAPGQSQ